MILARSSLPFAATLAAIVLLWNQVVSPPTSAILAVMYLITALGVTVGFHRLLTHRAFQAPKPVEYGFAALGSMAVQGPVIDWVADHRKHHAHTDKEGDPHSPHVGHGDGSGAVFRGLWHAHVGWLMTDQGPAARPQVRAGPLRGPGHAPDQPPVPAARPGRPGAARPRRLGDSGLAGGAATGFLWGGLVRVFLVHHVTWSVNSVCHFLGTRRFDDRRRVAQRVLARRCPRWASRGTTTTTRSRARRATGLRWWEIDMIGLVIRALERVGLARNVVRITPERQKELVQRPASR